MRTRGLDSLTKQSSRSSNLQRKQSAQLSVLPENVHERERRHHEDRRPAMADATATNRVNDSAHNLSAKTSKAEAKHPKNFITETF